MFKCMSKENLWPPVTVYWVDSINELFLVNVDGKFKWVPMSEFEPYND